MNEQTKKSALVLGGGGSRGSYSVGVLATLAEQNHSYQIVTGISIGALVGAVYAMRRQVDLPSWIAKMTQDRVADGLFSFPNRHAVYDTTITSFAQMIDIYQKNGPDFRPLRESYSQIFNFEEFKNSPVDFACIAANLTRNDETIFKKADMKTEDDALNAILASASYFPAFSFCKIGDDYYADGGFLKTTLGEAAIGMGADDLTIVALDDPDIELHYVKDRTSLLIRPIVRLDYFLDFDADQLTNQIEQGRLEALKYLNLAPGYIYTFYKEDALVLESLSKLMTNVLSRHNFMFQSDTLIEGITTLLGYKPAPLDNEYMKHYQAGLVLEILGLIAGITYYRRHHLIPFIKEILSSLQNYTVSFSQVDTQSTLKMDRIGARDLMSFFHAALTVYDGHLPDEFNIVVKKFQAIFYLAIAWYTLDKFAGVLKLI